MRFDQIIANNNESAIFCLTVYSKTLFLSSMQTNITSQVAKWRYTDGRHMAEVALYSLLQKFL